MARIQVLTTDEFGDTVLVGWFTREKATTYGEDTEWDGDNHISKATGSQWDHETLYRTAGGRWVLGRTSQRAKNPIPTYHYLDNDAAREWLIVQDHHDAVTEHFGEMEEEWGPDRPKPVSVPTVTTGSTKTRTILIPTDGTEVVLEHGDGRTAQVVQTAVHVVIRFPDDALNVAHMVDLEELLCKHRYRLLTDSCPGCDAEDD